MAIRNRRPVPGAIVHADHGVQFTSWVFTNKIRSADLMPSFGTIGDGYDNAMYRVCSLDETAASDPNVTVLSSSMGRVRTGEFESIARIEETIEALGESVTTAP